MINKIKSTFKELHYYEWLMILIMSGVSCYTLTLSLLDSSATPIWLAIVNFISAIAGVLCIFFVQKAGIANFVFATINTITYAVFLFYSKIYGTFFLEVLVYFPLNFIGFYLWSKHKDKEINHITKVKKLNIKNIILIILSTLIIFTINYIITSNYQDNISIVTLDSLIVGIGISAILLQTFRFKEHYYLWIISDIVSIILYIVSFNPLYLTKKIIYLISAIIGLEYWDKLNKDRNKENE